MPIVSKFYVCLQWNPYYCSYFTHDETEAQRGCETFLGSLKRQVVELELEPRQPGYKALTLNHCRWLPLRILKKACIAVTNWHRVGVIKKGGDAEYAPRYFLMSSLSSGTGFHYLYIPVHLVLSNPLYPGLLSRSSKNLWWKKERTVVDRLENADGLSSPLLAQPPWSLQAQEEWGWWALKYVIACFWR